MWWQFKLGGNGRAVTVLIDDKKEMEKFIKNNPEAVLEMRNEPRFWEKFMGCK